ncbi:uncharacterized protein BO88DRAFT_418433 [Aspergillus vadensis CBS 113365]|uniref:Uncharacterized protein n=1 Tax=Aspergillus vadensis (strain CBS 113365 / IMI 142717 / IBT 24658) TaxID=1448311 RepID=A0A319AZJ3_ASPVC|nr:hypothetical protein BO88DRAFT_418433 [Aspergillus vadensis CBS 113365]PYH65796.1 hypothetical protein BO88DRAFT_418433 [Aspergillus vadensis CBS 113365]
MTILTREASIMLERHTYQIPNNINCILSRTLPFFALPLIWHGHRSALYNTTLQPYMKKKTLQLSSRLLSSSLPRPRRGPQDSKRTPWWPLRWNDADLIETNMHDLGFQTSGIVIFRCTYKSDSDWEEFLSRSLHKVRTSLESYHGLELLDSFRPPIIDDKTQFDGVTPDNLRDQFNRWSATACEAEQGVPLTEYRWHSTARSVLDMPLESLDEWNNSGFVILVNGRHEVDRASIEESDEKIEDDDYEPLHGCTYEDVGWMKVCYDMAQVYTCAHLGASSWWEEDYRRPPKIALGLM